MGDASTMLGLSSGGGNLAQSAIQVKMARDQAKLARTAMAEQKDAQRQSLAAAQAAARKAEQAYARENKKKPQIDALLLAEQAKSGTASTLLTSPQGIDSSRQRLGRVGMLGD